MAAGRAAQMSLANFVVYFGLFITILIRSQRTELTQDIIFAAVEIVAFLHMYNFVLVLGIGAIVETSVLLKRFLAIYNLKNQESQTI